MRILLTAFEKYGEWAENSSWLTMVELLRELPPALQLVTRRYPVDLTELQAKLEQDLQQPYDAILHLGQSPGCGHLQLESIALNVVGCVDERGAELPCLVEGGPLAYRSRMPLGRWARKLRREMIPAAVSYHAGTFLCNATMYLTHFRCAKLKSQAKIGFVHLPLATEQVASMNQTTASLPTSTMAQGVHIILQDIAENLCSLEDQAVASEPT